MFGICRNIGKWSVIGAFKIIGFKFQKGMSALMNMWSIHDVDNLLFVFDILVGEFISEI